MFLFLRLLGGLRELFIFVGFFCSFSKLVSGCLFLFQLFNHITTILSSSKRCFFVFGIFVVLLQERKRKNKICSIVSAFNTLSL